jgi:hypothetical protein
MKVSKFTLGKGKYLLIGLAIYAALFFILMIVRGDILSDNETTKLWFGELRKDNDFLTSYVASSLDSLIFFIFIGVAAILISVKDPSDELLYQKINYIFPQTQRDTALSKYIEDEISSLACIVTDVKRTITIKDLSKCKEYIKLDIKGRSHIKNIFNKDDFVSDNMKFHMKADPVDFCDVWAEMLEASITCDVSKPVSAEQQLDGTITLNKDKISHSEALPITLAPNKDALYTTHGWFWQKLTGALNFNASRFVEKAIYDIKNDMDTIMHFSIESNRLQTGISERFINRIIDILSNSGSSVEKQKKLAKLVKPDENKEQLETKNYTLDPGKRTSIIFNNIIPSDKIIFSFKVPTIKVESKDKGEIK